jgi:hypothetical protein
MDWRACTLIRYLKTEDLFRNMNMGEDNRNEYYLIQDCL